MRATPHLPFVCALCHERTASTHNDMCRACAEKEEETTMRGVDEVVARAEKVKGYMHPRELRWLCETARAIERPATWCEIGCWQGRSATAALGGLLPGSSLVLVDNFTGPTTREMPNAAACKRRILEEMARMRVWAPGVSIELLVGYSADVAPQVADETLDVLFVDGDHKYEAVVADIEAWRPKMKHGGLMCGHDFTNRCGVEPAVRELLPQFGQVPDTSLWYAWV